MTNIISSGYYGEIYMIGSFFIVVHLIPICLLRREQKYIIMNHWQRGLNRLRPRQMAIVFVDNLFKCIFLIENIWISIKMSLYFAPSGPINSILALV